MSSSQTDQLSYQACTSLFECMCSFLLTFTANFHHQRDHISQYHTIHRGTLTLPYPRAAISFPIPSSKMDNLMRFALVLHLVIETTAAINFFLRPSATLSTPQPYSHGVIRQYALLLLTTNIIAAAVLNRAVYDDLSAHIAAALALYHAGPFVRAVSKIRRGNTGDILGGAWLHASSHLLCLACLLASSFPLW